MGARGPGDAFFRTRGLAQMPTNFSNASEQGASGKTRHRAFWDEILPQMAICWRRSNLNSLNSSFFGSFGFHVVNSLGLRTSSLIPSVTIETLKIKMFEKRLENKFRPTAVGPAALT